MCWVALFSIPSSATEKSYSGQDELAVTVVFTQNHTPYMSESRSRNELYNVCETASYVSETISDVNEPEVGKNDRSLWHSIMLDDLKKQL